MSKVIRYWQVEVFNDDVFCNDGAAIVGFQLSPEPEFNNGFLMLRDKTFVQMKGLSVKEFSGFSIIPIYEDEK